MRHKTLVLGTILMLCVTSYGLTADRDESKFTLPTPISGNQYLQRSITYPSMAKELRMESEVLLSFRVNPDGSVSHLTVLESGGRLFDLEAIRAVESTRWIPATCDGYAVATRFTLPIVFKLNRQ